MVGWCDWPQQGQHVPGGTRATPFIWGRPLETLGLGFQGDLIALCFFPVQGSSSERLLIYHCSSWSPDVLARATLSGSIAELSTLIRDCPAYTLKSRPVLLLLWSLSPSSVGRRDRLSILPQRCGCSALKLSEYFFELCVFKVVPVFGLLGGSAHRCS